MLLTDWLVAISFFMFLLLVRPMLSAKTIPRRAMPRACNQWLFCIPIDGRAFAAALVEWTDFASVFLLTLLFESRRFLIQRRGGFRILDRFCFETFWTTRIVSSSFSTILDFGSFWRVLLMVSSSSVTLDFGFFSIAVGLSWLSLSDFWSLTFWSTFGWTGLSSVEGVGLVASIEIVGSSGCNVASVDESVVLGWLVAWFELSTSVLVSVFWPDVVVAVPNSAVSSLVLAGAMVSDETFLSSVAGVTVVFEVSIWLFAHFPLWSVSTVDPVVVLSLDGVAFGSILDSAAESLPACESLTAVSPISGWWLSVFSTLTLSVVAFGALSAVGEAVAGVMSELTARSLSIAGSVTGDSVSVDLWLSTFRLR